MDLKEKAKTCNSCLAWLSICNAECCKVFSVNSKMLVKTKGFYKVKAYLNHDDLRYYELRGCRYVNNTLLMKRKDYVVVVEGELTHFIKVCSALTKDNLCGLQDSKPEVCKAFNELGGNDNNKTVTTPSCLARFKE